MDSRDYNCPMPLVALRIFGDGSLGICGRESKSTPINSSIKKYYIDEFDSFDQFSKVFRKEIQSYFYNDGLPYFCKLCQEEEKRGAISLRQTQRSFLSDTSVGPIKYLDISLGRVCNLQCLMCSPMNSTSQDKLYSDEVVKKLKGKRDTPFDISFIDGVFFKELVKDLEHILMLGGEPLMSELHIPILRKLVELNKAKDLRLWYDTNGTVVPSSELIQLWKEFKKVEVSISLDDSGIGYEYIRHPMSWERFSVCFEKYVNLARENIIELQTSMLMQAFNIFSLPAMFSFLNQYEDVVESIPYLNIIHNPPYYQIELLPHEVIVNSLEKNKELIKKVGQKESEKRLVHYLDYLQAIEVKEDPQLLFAMKVQIKKIDQIRKRSFLETYPLVAQSIGLS
jgi:molybdenum cofactor biosynthesis enzyme MoaA